MTELADFFFTAPPAAVRFQLLEISHPSFSTTYRIVRNSPGGVYVNHEDEAFPTFYQYLPLKLEEIGSENNLDQSLNITVGDLGELIPTEIELANAANTMGTKPTLVYREYRSDDVVIAGVEGGDWIFDGVDDQVSMGGLAFDQDRTDTFSVAAWINVTAAGGTIIAKQSGAATTGWRISDTVNFIMNSSTGGFLQVGPATPVSTGVEHFVCITYNGNSDGSGVKIYVDGVQETTSVLLNTMASGTTSNIESLKIGICNTVLAFEGQIRHVTVWDQVLTAGQVAALYNNGTPPNVREAVGDTTFDLVCGGWWRLDYSDTIGLGGVEDHATGSIPGTAGGGLAPAGTIDAPVFFTPVFGPVTLEITTIGFNKEGATFSARPKMFNRTRTGEYYITERFPMLNGFL